MPVSHAKSVASPLIESFLFSPAGQGANGTTITVLSALARHDFDPWGEAAKLSLLPEHTAVNQLVFDRFSCLLHLLHEEANGFGQKLLMSTAPFGVSSCRLAAHRTLTRCSDNRLVCLRAHGDLAASVRTFRRQKHRERRCELATATRDASGRRTPAKRTISMIDE